MINLIYKAAVDIQIWIYPIERPLKLTLIALYFDYIYVSELYWLNESCGELQSMG